MVRGRRRALAALVALVACGQALCVLELLGVPLRPPGLVLGIEALVILIAIVTAKGEEPIELSRWAGIGLASWVIWGTLYFGAAKLTVAPTARTFDDAVLEHLPLVPAFTPIYLGVHVFSMVPYCAIPEARKLRRYLLGQLLIVMLAAIAWVALPVRLDRPPIPEHLTGFGAWLLRLVYQGDPTTNCFPSAHCSVAVYAAIGLRFASRRLFAWGIATAIAICVSTVLTKQHYVLDVVAGAVLAAIAAYAMSRRA
jgi:membrane-associated phospholipid phosphatase